MFSGTSIVSGPIACFKLGIDSLRAQKDIHDERVCGSVVMSGFAVWLEEDVSGRFELIDSGRCELIDSGRFELIDSGSFELEDSGRFVLGGS